jgi:hypothetical protein
MYGSNPPEEQAPVVVTVMVSGVVVVKRKKAAGHGSSSTPGRGLALVRFRELVVAQMVAPFVRVSVGVVGKSKWKSGGGVNAWDGWRHFTRQAGRHNVFSFSAGLL